jgi:hypothetical protein
MTNPEVLIKQLEDLISKGYDLAPSNLNTPFQVEYSVATSDQKMILVRIHAAIKRIAGKNSTYYQDFKKRLESFEFNGVTVMRNVVSVAEALKLDLEAGYLLSIQQLIHADLFSDYLEMASHLLETRYKDAAAVIAGSTLETHLRQLAIQNGVPIHRDKGKNKTMDSLSQDLIKASVYGKAEGRVIGGWTGIRNDAAHGNYGEYQDEAVRLMIMGIQDFIVRHPA